MNIGQKGRCIFLKVVTTFKYNNHKLTYGFVTQFGRVSDF